LPPRATTTWGGFHRTPSSLGAGTAAGRHWPAPDMVLLCCRDDWGRCPAPSASHGILVTLGPPTNERHLGDERPRHRATALSVPRRLGHDLGWGARVRFRYRAGSIRLPGGHRRELAGQATRATTPGRDLGCRRARLPQLQRRLPRRPEVRVVAFTRRRSRHSRSAVPGLARRAQYPDGIASRTKATWRRSARASTCTMSLRVQRRAPRVVCTPLARVAAARTSRSWAGRHLAQRRGR